MAVIFPVTRLYDAVRARFLAESVPVAMLFGWRTPFQQLETGNRIVWVPGDPDGALGELLPPKYPGRNPRALANLGELFYVEISAADVADPENERAQYQATRELFDTWLRAVQLAAHGTYRVVSAKWLTEKNDRRHGAAIRAVVSIQSVVFDQVFEGVEANAGHAALNVAELEVTESLSVDPA